MAGVCWVDKTVFYASIGIARLLTFAWFRVTVEGTEHRGVRPALYVINHSSNLDVPILAWVVKGPVRFLAKEELFRVPVLSLWLRCVGGIPVARGQGDQKALDTALMHLRSGGVLFMAPEGTRKGQPGERPVRSGFIRLAQLARCPVVPVAVSGAGEAMPPGARFPRPKRLRLRIGKPLLLDPVEVNVENRDTLREQANEVMRIVYHMKENLDANRS